MKNYWSLTEDCLQLYPRWRGTISVSVVEQVCWRQLIPHVLLVSILTPKGTRRLLFRNSSFFALIQCIYNSCVELAQGACMDSALAELHQLLAGNEQIRLTAVGAWSSRWGSLLAIVRVAEIWTAKAISGGVLNSLRGWQKMIHQHNQHSRHSAAQRLRPTNRLTDEQLQAAVIDEQAVLVVAGAGTGKTSTIIGRVHYLTQEKGVSAHNILVLAFNREVRRELSERLAVQQKANIAVHTFHSLGMALVCESSGNKQRISPLSLREEQMKQWITMTLQAMLAESKWRLCLADWLGMTRHRTPEQAEILVRYPSARILRRCIPHLVAALARWQEEGEPNHGHAGIELAIELLQRYRKYLKRSNETDFGSMIREAGLYVQQGRCATPWQQIIIDEFQDISQGRAALVRAIRDRCKADLFCVGDDWQSIYGFAGSRPDLMTQFEDHWGEHVRVDLSRTFRYNQKILAVSSTFIQRNPQQLRKNLSADEAGLEAAVCLVRYPGSGEGVQAVPNGPLWHCFRTVCAKIDQLHTASTVLVLSRYHANRPGFLHELQQQYTQLDIRFLTIHQAKGSEADHVIVTDFHCDSRQFPPARRQDVPPLVHSLDEEFPFAEERRLLYVALTRARHTVTLIAPERSRSPFLKELQQIL